LNSWIGILIALSKSDQIKDIFLYVQHDLFDLGAQISVPGTPLLSRRHLTRIENAFEKLNGELCMLKEFILPGGVLSSAFGHVARTVCRRAERQLVHLMEFQTTMEGGMDGGLELKRDHGWAEGFGISYLNRLSDLLFVACRIENREGGGTDVLWERGKSSTTPPQA